MKKHTDRKNLKPQTILPLRSDQLRDIHGGSGGSGGSGGILWGQGGDGSATRGDAYFIKVDRETTT